MTWPSPPPAIDHFARVVFACVVIVVLAWITRPVFAFLMRVLQ